MSQEKKAGRGRSYLQDMRGIATFMKHRVKACVVLSALLLCRGETLAAQDSFSGVYRMVNQADYDADKRWFEITRNKYQEIIVNGEKFDSCVAYYDQVAKELFFVIKKPAQYNTLMKFKFIDASAIEVYMLADNRWQKAVEPYIREK